MRVLSYFGKGGGGGGHGGGGHGHGGSHTIVVGGGGFYPGYDTAGYLVNDDSCRDVRARVAMLESLLRANNIKF